MHPADADIGFIIEMINGKKCQCTIRPNGNFTQTGVDELGITPANYRSTALRQHEVVTFIQSPKAEKYSALLPLLGLQGLEIAAENIRQLSRNIEQQGKLPASRSMVDAARLRQQQVFGCTDQAVVEKSIAALHHSFCPNSAHDAPIADLCAEAEAAIGERLAALTPEQNRHRALRDLAEFDIVDSLGSVRRANAKLADAVEPLIQERLGLLQAANVYGAKVQDDIDISCPACGQPIRATDFKNHIAGEQVRLKVLVFDFEFRKTAISNLIESVKAVKRSLADPAVSVWLEQTKLGVAFKHISWLEAFDPEALRASCDELAIQNIEASIRAISREADAASRNAPPEARELARATTQIEAIKTIVAAIGAAAHIAKVESLLAFLGGIESGIRTEIRTRSTAVIGEISKDIRRMWAFLHLGDQIDNIRLYLPDDNKAIDVGLKFHGKEQDSPRLTLSEGYRNSLGLCIFLAMAKRGDDTDRPLFLDDVVISLDRSHRGMIAGLLESEFKNRQVILFTHDRVWYADLQRQFSGKWWDFRALRPYETPKIGISWSHKTTTFDDARSFLHNRPDTAGAEARKIMDVELTIVAEKLRLRLPFKQGESNEHRMAHEFITQLRSDGGACFQRKVGNVHARYQDALDLLGEVDRLLQSWANRGSHSYDVVRVEATKLIDKCEEAMALFKCNGCEKFIWYADAGGPENKQCECGTIRWRYGKS